MIPALPTADLPPAQAVAQALVEYAVERCAAERVDVHVLGVDTSRWEPGATFVWSGEPCAAHPELMLSASRDAVQERRVAVRPYITVWVKAPVAAVDHEPGAPVQSTWAEVPVESLGGQAPLSTGIARVRVKAGEPLTAWVVAEPVDIKQGAAVSLVVRRGALTISADGTSLEDARVGDTVRVVNSATKTTLRGTLIDPNTVEIR
jgi:flagella basal body P-ring formation protein FlgA